MSSPDVRASRALSRLLRHKPERYGVTLDHRGWGDVEAVLAGLCRVGVTLDAERLAELVARSPKRRFELTADGARIRAVHGHSIEVELDHPTERPPEVLFHGTVAPHIAGILREGLRPGARRAVHLSEREAEAREVGARRGAPIVLRIAAGRMSDAGHRFQRSTSGVWLTEAVPPEYLEPPSWL